LRSIVSVANGIFNSAQANTTIHFSIGSGGQDQATQELYANIGNSYESAGAWLAIAAFIVY